MLAAFIAHRADPIHEAPPHEGELRAARQAITNLESEVATARKTVDELRKQLEVARTASNRHQAALAKAESDRSTAEDLVRLAEQTNATRATEYTARATEHARALESQQTSARAALDAERARITSIERERDGAKQAAKDAVKSAAIEATRVAEARIASITQLADNQAEQILLLEQQIIDTRATLDEFRAHANSDQDMPSLAQIETLAEARVTEMIQPKLEQLAQVASFLRTRRERLSALRMGLKRKAKELKAMQSRAAVAQPIVRPSSTAEIEAERVELARERQEIVDLRSMLHSSEEAVGRRAAGTRFFTSAALCSTMLGLAALCAWSVSGMLVPAPVVATVELEVNSRVQDSKSESANAAEMNGEATSIATPIAMLVKERVDDPIWGGLVSARLAERGRTHAESDALVQNLAERVTVSSEGSTIRLALRGEGEAATRTTLDAIATTAVAEANRDPSRRSDFLRVGIANAKQEVGRTVFAVAEVMPDPERLKRAGALFAIIVLVGAGFVGVVMLLSRRPAKSMEPAMLLHD